MVAVARFFVFSLFASTVADTNPNATKIMIDKGEKDPILEYSESGGSQVPAEVKTILKFVSDYASQSKLEEILLFVPYSLGQLNFYSTGIYEYFSSRGVYVSIHSTWQQLLPRYFYHNRHRLGVAVLWEPEMDYFADGLSYSAAFDEYQSWLFITREAHRKMNMSYKLRKLNLRLDSNAVICRLERQIAPTRVPTTSTTAEDDELRYYEVGEKVCVPENRDEEWYRGICIAGSALPQRIKRETSSDAETVIVLHQIYKVPGFEDDLVQIYLGFWDPANGLKNSKGLVPVEKRLPLGSFAIAVGVRNATFEAGTTPAKSFAIDRDEDEEIHMKEFLDCLLYDLPARPEIQHFPKLGWRNEEGGWTHLLGSVVEGLIDFALDTFSVNMDTFQEMSLSHPVVKAMNNIYFRRPESGGMRDIFLAPFSPNLLASVVGTALLLALAMISVAFVTEKLNPEEKTKEKGKRRWEVSEAALWSVSVMCMQGSPWCPISKSGSLLLISSLLFALVMYNAYAAFITSVLSVKTMRIKALEDLLHSDFAFGYTLGNADELFLRTVNNSLLRELYFKGLKENDGVKDPIAGMRRVGAGEYAFFVAARTARRALRREVAHNQRCGIQELILPVTSTVAAIPISRYSPFKKALNFRILRMMESGILRRLQFLILPPMPKCVERNKFNSARFADVYSAFYMIIFGWIVSWVLFLGEILWYRRKSIKERSKAKIFGHHEFHWPREEESRRKLDGDDALVNV